jgi:hypothetical protein
MKRVLLIGFDPATVDFSDPALRGQTKHYQNKVGYANGWNLRNGGLQKVVSAAN